MEKKGYISTLMAVWHYCNLGGKAETAEWQILTIPYEDPSKLLLYDELPHKRVRDSL